MSKARGRRRATGSAVICLLKMSSSIARFVSGDLLACHHEGHDEKIRLLPHLVFAEVCGHVRPPVRVANRGVDQVQREALSHPPGPVDQNARSTLKAWRASAAAANTHSMASSMRQNRNTMSCSSGHAKDIFSDT